MSVSGDDALRPTSDIPMPSEAARSGNVGDVRRGGWLIRITVIVIVILWSVPTLGVLIT